MMFFNYCYFHLTISNSFLSVNKFNKIVKQTYTAVLMIQRVLASLAQHSYRFIQGMVSGAKFRILQREIVAGDRFPM